MILSFQQPFDNENPIHFQVLITLYKQFTGSKLDCPRYGSHWEQIGFQVRFQKCLVYIRIYSVSIF